jgi:hypothetical protein
MEIGVIHHLRAFFSKLLVLGSFAHDRPMGRIDIT